MQLTVQASKMTFEASYLLQEKLLLDIKVSLEAVRDAELKLFLTQLNSQQEKDLLSSHKNAEDFTHVVLLYM